jgi:mono/diheme cytochrome c family protein
MKLKKILATASLVTVVAILGTCGGADDELEGSSTTNKFPVELTDSRIDAGEVVYSQNCASCHGPVQGPVALEGAPVHGDGGHTWHHPDRLLYQWVLDRPPLATTMPAFRGVLSDEEVLEVLAYIKSNWIPEIQERQNTGSAQYEAQIIDNGSN